MSSLVSVSVLLVKQVNRVGSLSGVDVTDLH